ncbi:23815_t:CDS:10 [Gigaspora margarita]|uniref:23815_t:CDS:1 n=1 Tax=Gigaspora margarita TaxID=4874 RepID=A0ABM8W5T6_GIGMA|nr:23815_t:CDS:10 [Gigaspora margarita]
MSQTDNERDFKKRNNASNECFKCGLPGHFSRECTNGVSRKPTENLKPLLNPNDIEENQLKALSDSFNSAALSYGGSDKIVFTPFGDELKNAWKRFIKKELIQQHNIRRFITSCLSAADKEGEVEELVTELGQSEGLKRIREIVMFPMSVDAGLAAKVASFQRVILPFMALLTRSGVTECILEKYVHTIFYTVYLNLDSFMHNGVINMLEILVKRNDIIDKKVNQSKLLEDDSIAFIPTSLCNVFMKRIKEASTNETMYKIVTKIEQIKKLWQNTLQNIKSTYNEPLVSDFARREYFFIILDKEIDSIKKILNYGRRNLLSQTTFTISSTKSNKPSTDYRKLAKKVASILDYDPPGDLSENGKRHNNDFKEISRIKIIPTKEEVLCDRYPFLPTMNIDDAMHYLPKGAERLLDTQFRLLREDMLCPIRIGIENFIKFISESAKNKAKIKKLQEHGGRHKYENKEGMEGGDLNVYANVHFSVVKVDKRRGFYCRLGFTQPPMRCHSESKEGRLQYWDKSRKLLTGSLVCLLWPSENSSLNNGLQFSLFFGTVVLRDEHLLSQNQNIAFIDISFIDSEIYQIALKEINKKFFNDSNEQKTGCFMVESIGVYFESYFHVLKTLQKKLPSNFPFEKYLTPQITENSSVTAVDLPTYTRAPGFAFDLSVLLKDKTKPLLLNVADIYSHETVIQNLQESSSLDNTQAQSLVYSLCREIALIEGPPGTGKSFVGVEIMKVLLANKKATKMGPILTICFTNHALDQFLENLLKVGIEKIVRLGGRSKSEIIKNFTIEEMYKKNEYSTFHGDTHKERAELIRIQNETENILKSFSCRWLDWYNINDYLLVEYPDHWERFRNPDIPDFIFETNDSEDDDLSETNDNKGKWQNVTNKNNKNKSIFHQWICGNDLDLAQRWAVDFQTQNNRRTTKANINKFDTLRDLSDSDDYDDSENNNIQNWVRPEGNRPLEDLKADYNVWQMSKAERIKLHDFWKDEIHLDYLDKLDKIQGQYEKTKNDLDRINDAGRCQILRNCDVIGMTTIGAAKYQNLICSVGPRIIVCEEAGEVLEAHILSALTPEAQHMILIGDHNQLRPHCATYNLTCDSKIGINYALDKSLFERLVNGDQATRLEKSQLCTQRRMRKEISDLIRYTLYEELVDDKITNSYPDVCGAQKNVYFMNHRHPEDSIESDFAVNSHSNTFEAKMVIGLVKHFIRNGYDKPGQIAVLTPYLGQLIKIRDMLSKSFVVVIDERDDQLITDMEESIDSENKNPDGESTFSIEKMSSSEKKLSQQVILRTVDNFQGEEADIIIISLVRNVKKVDDRGTIGFLKSTNRSNVLLSRAKHGMFLLGNADLMERHSDFWKNVLKILRERGQVGPGFPIVCAQHPYYKNNIYEASQFNEISPDGGCFEPCPYKCHSDDMQHIGVFCRKACTRLYPDCQHPCRNKMCGEDCGDCLWPIGDITLPCGHKYKNAKCHHNKNIDKVLCHEQMLRKLPNCEHKHLIECHVSIYDFQCTEKCGGRLSCGHSCMSTCFECQNLSKKAKQNPPFYNMGQIVRSNHGKCAQKCERHKGACNLPCGVPCNRLPCDLRCEKRLYCGHQCFGLCGEKCPPSKYCAECTTDNNVKDQVVDLIMRETFSEVDWTSERMVVLGCGHVYTTESLDHLMNMKEYYEMDKNNKWIRIKSITSQPSDPKSCPQCRTPIKGIYRYGRAIKKQVLDIQNKKFLVKYDNQLKKLNKDIINATKRLENSRKKFLKEIQLPLKTMEKNITEKDSTLQLIPEVIPIEQYTLLEQFSIPLMQKKRWERHISMLLYIYRALILLMSETKSPPYKLAYNTAVSLLYAFKTRINIFDLGKNFESLDNSDYDSPARQHLKLQETLAEVGLMDPKVDVYIYLDTFLEIVNIQKAIFHEVFLVVPELSSMEGSANETNWVEFGENIIITIKKHLDTIITTAQQNSYFRHAILSSLELAEVECKAERFKLKYPSAGIITPIIQQFVKSKCSDIEGTCNYICNEMLPKMNAEHFENQCKIRIEEIRREVSDLRDAAMTNRPLKYEEKLEIRNAMGSELQGSESDYIKVRSIFVEVFVLIYVPYLLSCLDCGEPVGGQSNFFQNLEIELTNVLFCKLLIITC